MSTKTDRELLELAAKAAGIRLLEKGDGYWMIQSSDRGMKGWNPLLNDGDALRLAVKLTLEIDVCLYRIAVRTQNGIKILVDSDECNDIYAATRLAIVRAAAAIGEAMP